MDISISPETGRITSISIKDGEQIVFPDSRMNMENFSCFVYRDGSYIYAPLPAEEPDDPDKKIANLKAQVQALEETNSMYEEILVELAEIVYA